MIYIYVYLFSRKNKKFASESWMAKNYEWKVLYEPLIIPSVIRSLSNIWLLYVTVVRSAIIQGPFFQRKASILDLLSALFKIREATEVLKSLSSWKNPLVCHAMQQVRSIKLKRKKCLRTSRQKENNYFFFQHSNLPFQLTCVIISISWE